jgi:hypothetical protein
VVTSPMIATSRRAAPEVVPVSTCAVTTGGR